MKRIKLTVAYDGTHYCGWQIQPNGITVEEVLNRVISKALGEEIKIIGASRTDSGVHALGNVAVFNTNTIIPPERICYVLNQELPEDIAIMKSEEVSLEFHPRYCNTKKTYEYQIMNQKIILPTLRNTHYFVSYEMNLEKMREAAEYLIGEHDFVSFSSAKTTVEDTVREIYSLDIIEDMNRENQILIRVRGNGFLYNMVRIIVGMLVNVGRGFYEPIHVKQLLESQNRTSDRVTAPPQGLCLVKIEYEGEVNIR